MRVLQLKKGISAGAALICASTLAVALTAAIPATAEPQPIIEAGWGSPLNLNAGLLPASLPKQDRTPVAVVFSGRIEGRGQEIPVLREMTLDLDRDGAVDVAGLPTCSRRQLLASGKSLVRSCQKAQVGAGIAHVALAAQPEPSAIKLRLFNGGAREGTVTAFLRAFIPAPVSAPVLAVIKLKPLNQGPYGLRASTELPVIPDGMANLLDFSLRINRLTAHNSSFAMARCSRQRLDARLTSYELGTGELLSGPTFIRPCYVAG